MVSRANPPRDAEKRAGHLRAQKRDPVQELTMKSIRLFLIVLSFACMVYADPEASPPKDKTKTTIQSDYGDFDYKTKKGIFEGNVVVTDVQLKLKSDKMIVYLAEKDNSVTKVEAMGSVQIDHEGKTAYADNAVYSKDTGVILL